ARRTSSPVVFQSQPLDRRRPSVAEEVSRPPKPPELLGRADAEQMIALARSAMVTRSRDLDAFAYANVDDVSLVDDRDGLQFALIGMLPHRRFLLETQYGFLALKNGIPVSYGSIVGLFASAEVAYTVFDTFRGSESARLYARTLSMAANVFGCDTFVISPYQLGEDNEDALASGAWWFYQKLGYRPRDPKLLRLMKQETAKMARRAAHRSTMETLKRLASGNIYLDLAPQRDDVLGELDLANVSLKIADSLAATCGSDREKGLRQAAAEVADVLEIDDVASWSKLERAAWLQWAPLLSLMPTAARWSPENKRAVADLVRAKAGRQELDYLRQFNRLRVLREAVATLAQDG
ncbi:MAG: hypothetical protein KDA41_06220, partial [Planctomycetales bacterium]|nr:hypothetical protein [Planctomycetales bacterium]